MTGSLRKLGHTYRSFTNALAVALVEAMSTFECVVLFLLLALSPMLVAGIEGTVQYISGAVIQLVALPAIMLGQVLANRRAEARAASDHVLLKQVVADLGQIKKALVE